MLTQDKGINKTNHYIINQWLSFQRRASYWITQPQTSLYVDQEMKKGKTYLKLWLQKFQASTIKPEKIVSMQVNMLQIQLDQESQIKSKLFRNHQVTMTWMMIRWKLSHKMMMNSLITFFFLRNLPILLQSAHKAQKNLNNWWQEDKVDNRINLLMLFSRKESSIGRKTN